MGVIDLDYVTKQAKSVPEMLGRHGLPTNINEAIGLLAGMIRNHAHFGRILAEMEPEDRAEFYQAVVPLLKFTAKPMEMYIAEERQAMDRKGDPFITDVGYRENASGAVRDARSIEKDAENAIAAEIAKRTLTLECAKCTFQQKFAAMEGETPVAVIMRARKAGWVYDYLSTPPREICPSCPTSLRPNAEN